MSWKVPSPHKLKCACMYVSPSVELTHLTNPLSLFELTAEDATETGATGSLAAPETSERCGCEQLARRLLRLQGYKVLYVGVAVEMGGWWAIGCGWCVWVFAGWTVSLLSFPTAINAN